MRRPERKGHERRLIQVSPLSTPCWTRPTRLLKDVEEAFAARQADAPHATTRRLLPSLGEPSRRQDPRVIADRGLHHRGPTRNSLITLEWDGRTENVVLAPVGTGKSHFIEGLALAAIEKDPRVAWFSRGILAAAIGKSKGDGSTARTVFRICGADLIAIRDIGLLPVGGDAAEATTESSTPPSGTPLATGMDF
ncbi:ATP-binding protein [Streptomyces sp. NPDC001507]|uniref:ATP-binding protein n=1 Tax=Streptomyces sp. NPDC001507 TaxID=3364579 RepID=UPI0036D1CF63